MSEPRRSTRPTLRHAHALAAGVLGLLASGSIAGPGPDITPSELADTYSYGTAPGTGVHAYDLGTVTCNPGTANVLWEGSTNQHPVITMNAYRLKAGRFEQVGMSWVKHAFYAASEPQCGYLCNGQGGALLGVGCSDPYTFGTNGLQAFLGPRSAINPSTGVFAYSQSTPNTWPPVQDATSRRLQISTSDVNPAINVGAVYFGETVYVAPDDAAAGNWSNNISYRRMTFASDSVFTSSFAADPTRIGVPAIFGWREIDPAVRIVAVDVPGEGRFWLANVVTNNGNGTWHYEYVLLNQSSDRSAGSFVVPLPSGVVVTNREVSQVPHHSGETYLNSPWTMTTLPSSLTFGTPLTFAQQPNTSALRWATAYTFRFDADRPPGSGAVAIGLFKPGSGPNASVSALFPSAQTPNGVSVAVQTPVNDACAAALPAHVGLNAFSTHGATASGFGACSEHGSSDLFADVWFTYTFNDTCAGPITFSTCAGGSGPGALASEFDTKIAVYAGSGCSPLGALLGCNDDAPALCAGVTTSSSVTISGSSGATYLIRVGSRAAAAGSALLNIEVPRCVPSPGACCYADGSCMLTEGSASCTQQGGASYLGANIACDPNACPQPPRPPNDACASAVALADVNTPNSGGSVVYGTTQWALPASPTGEFTICGGRANNDVWYRYTPAVSGSVTIDACAPFQPGDMSSPGMDVRAGSCAQAPFACEENGCGPNGQHPRLITNLNAGTIYFIRVFNAFGTTGTFGIKVSGGGGTLAGACCDGASCAIVLPAACTGPNKRFTSTATACNAPGDATTPCCKANFNGVGRVTIQDLFDYLSAWFAKSPSADFNGAPPTSAGVTVQDLFDFLTAWFLSGC